MYVSFFSQVIDARLALPTMQYLILLLPFFSCTASLETPNPLAAIIPQDVLIWQGRHELVTHHTDVYHFLRHMSDISELGAKIAQDIVNSGINDTVYSDQMLTQSTDSLKDLANTIAATIAILPHPLECRPTSSTSTLITKRSTRFHNGWFGAAGEAWSILTGSLPRSAGEYIDENTQRLDAIEQSEDHFIKAINHTAMVARQNSDNIYVLKSRVADLAEHLDKDMSMIYHKTQADNWASALRSAVLDNKLKVAKTLDAWVAASKGEITPKLLTTEFWAQIKKVIDKDTLQHHNIEYLLAETTKISVRVCSTHVYVDLDIPLLSRQTHTALTVHPFTIHSKERYYQLAEVPQRVVFGDMTTWTFSIDEWDRCTKTQIAVLCERPKTSELNDESCLFRIRNSLETQKQCHTKVVAKPKDSIRHVGNVIQYSLFDSPKLALTQCHGTQKSQKELSGSGIIRIPYRCRVVVNRKIFYNRQRVATQFNNTFKFYVPNMPETSHISKYAKIMNKPVATPPPSDDFHMIQRELNNSQASFGTLAYHKNHIGYVSIGSGTVAAITAIALVLLFTWVKCYILSAQKRYRPRPRADSLP